MSKCYACGSMRLHTYPTVHTRSIRVCEPCAKAQRIATESFEADELTPIHDHGLSSNSERGEGSPQETAPAKSPLPTRSFDIAEIVKLKTTPWGEYHPTSCGCGVCR